MLQHLVDYTQDYAYEPYDSNLADLRTVVHRVSLSYFAIK